MVAATASAQADTLVEALVPSRATTDVEPDAEREAASVTAVEPARCAYHWDRGRPRLALSTRLDLGALARVQVHVGYGRPYWMWVGIEAHALSTSEFGALYIGARASSPVLEVSAGFRFDEAYRRGPLPRQARYTDGDLASSSAPSRYRAVDLDLYGVIPAGRLLLPLEVALSYLPAPGVRYEEWYRIVATSHWVLAVRAAPLLVADNRRRHRVGVLAEWLRDLGRAVSTYRIGAVYQFAITPIVDLYIVGSLPISSPDGLSVWNDLYGTASVRYRWASGDHDRPTIRMLRGDSR